MDVKELRQISGPPEAHWYYRAKFDLLAETVGDFGAQRVVDVGAGSGVFARLLLQRTGCREATCVDPAYDQDSDERTDGKLLRFRRDFERRDFDLALLMDVLEHVDDDVALLAATAASARSGTPIFITAPAFEFLWSAHDVFLEHRRRYTARTLEHAISEAKLRIDWIRYFYATILPPVALLRLFTRGRDPGEGSDLRPASAPVTWLLDKALTAERRLLFPINRFAGLSVVAVARTK